MVDTTSHTTDIKSDERTVHTAGDDLQVGLNVSSVHVTGCDRLLRDSTGECYAVLIELDNGNTRSSRGIGNVCRQMIQAGLIDPDTRRVEGEGTATIYNRSALKVE